VVLETGLEGRELGGKPEVVGESIERLFMECLGSCSIRTWKRMKDEDILLTFFFSFHRNFLPDKFLSFTNISSNLFIFITTGL